MEEECREVTSVFFGFLHSPLLRHITAFLFCFFFWLPWRVVMQCTKNKTRLYLLFPQSDEKENRWPHKSREIHVFGITMWLPHFVSTYKTMWLHERQSRRDCDDLMRCAITVITEFISLPAQMCLCGGLPRNHSLFLGSKIWWTFWCCIKKILILWKTFGAKKGRAVRF